jgi:hypothetical protein
MPFFRFLDRPQIKKSCQESSLETLKNLNHRYGDAIENITKNEIKNEKKIAYINQQITRISLKIEENNFYRQQALEYRQNILDNLPRDPAERYLAQQEALNIYDNGPSLQEQMRALEKEKENLTQSQSRLAAELHDCVLELRIVNAVIKEKEFASTVAQTPLPR